MQQQFNHVKINKIINSIGNDSDNISNNFNYYVMKENDIPAFPNTDGQSFCNDGMTLRDYFAAKAMQSMLSSDKMMLLISDKGIKNDTNWEEVLSENAYTISDEMLKQREL